MKVCYKYNTNRDPYQERFTIERIMTERFKLYQIVPYPEENIPVVAETFSIYHTVPE